MAHRISPNKPRLHLSWRLLFCSLMVLGLALFATPSTAQTIPPIPPTALPPTALPTETATPLPAAPLPTTPLPAAATPTNSAAATPTNSATAAPTDPPTATATPLPHLYISEFLADPKAVKDEAGEWIELYNADSQRVNLRGWHLRDLGTDRHTIAVDLLIEPGQYLVLVRNSDTALNGGVLSSYTYNNLTLANSSDELLLLAPDETEVDRVQWGDGTSLSIQAGASRQRWLNGDASWATSGELWPGSSGDLGSPGSAYYPPAASPTAVATATVAPGTTPVPGAAWPQARTTSPLLIDELLYRGSAEEFVVLINVSEAALDLSGWAIGDEESPGAGEGMYALPTGYPLEAGARFVIARDGASFRATWGAPANAEFGNSDDATANLTPQRALASGQWALNDSGDEVILLNPNGEVADALVYGDGAYASLNTDGLLVAPTSFSLQRVPGATYSAGTDQRHRFLYASPQPFTTIQLPVAAAAAAPQPLDETWLALWGSLGAESNFSPTGSTPPHYLLAAAAAHGLQFMAIADPTIVTPWETAAAITRLPAWRWQGESEQAIVYDQDPQATIDGETLVGNASRNHTPLQWQDGVVPDASVVAAVAADTITAPGTISRLYSAWRAAEAPLLPAGNAAPPQPGQLLSAPRYTGLVTQSNDAAGIRAALSARRGWLTNRPGLWLTLAQLDEQGTPIWMGSTIPSENTVTLEIQYGDSQGDLAGLALWQDNRPLRQLDLPAGNQRWQVTIPALPNTFLYAVATQSDGDFAVTAPLYVLPATGGAAQLNEVLPAPWADHNGDGVVNTDDEFIELYNPSPQPLSLDGWQLLDASADAGNGRAFTFGTGQVIRGHDWLVLYHSASHISLNNENESVSLRNPDGTEVDRIGWEVNPGRGSSLSRLPDGATWQRGHATPGGANEPFSEDRVAPYPGTSGSNNNPTPSKRKKDEDEDDNELPPPVQLDPSYGQAGGPPASVAQSKLSGLEADVEFYAVVIAPPGLFNATIYVADPAPDPRNGPYAGIGINIYSRQALYPALQEGDRVRVRGTLKSFRGEMELQLLNATTIQRVGTGTPLQPLPVTGTEIGESLEGRLVTFRGIVSGWQGDSIYLSDPTNPNAEAVRVTVRSSTGLRRPYVNRGEQWHVTGIVSQFASEAPWNGGYRVLVRYKEDLVKVKP